jgi:large subunit ribosomal protein L34e
MPEPRFRSRSLRRVKKKRPGGQIVTHYEKRNPSVPKCANCKTELKGIPRKRPHKMQKLGLSKKRVERPYGGYLCSNCLKKLIKEEARE